MTGNGPRPAWPEGVGLGGDAIALSVTDGNVWRSASVEPGRNTSVGAGFVLESPPAGFFRRDATTRMAVRDSKEAPMKTTWPIAALAIAMMTSQAPAQTPAPAPPVTDLMEALELGYMLDCAETIVAGAIAREESRGAHYRTDFEQRDDQNWLAHTMIARTSGGLQIRKKPVTITEFQPKERKY